MFGMKIHASGTSCCIYFSARRHQKAKLLSLPGFLWLQTQYSLQEHTNYCLCQLKIHWICSKHLLRQSPEKLRKDAGGCPSLFIF
uniref:Uncharacterized protein n=1 Tax=Arundo donax TaxID=35708 RepID=A0A0A8YFS2_ARUDO